MGGRAAAVGPIDHRSTRVLVTVVPATGEPRRRERNLMSVRKRVALAATGLLLGGGLLAGPLASASVAAPASSIAAQSYIDGSGSKVTDDWGDEGQLSTTSHSHSNATGLWQVILWADGAKESNGTKFDYSDIDCKFSPNTKAATKSWQAGEGLTKDGIVGTKTFGRADDYLDNQGNGVVTYHGWDHDVWLKRVGGKYEVRIHAAKGYKVAYYNTITAC